MKACLFRLSFALSIGVLGSAAASAEEIWTLHNGSSTLSFDGELLAKYGIAVASTNDSDPAEDYRVRLEAAPSLEPMLLEDGWSFSTGHVGHLEGIVFSTASGRFVVPNVLRPIGWMDETVADADSVTLVIGEGDVTFDRPSHELLIDASPIVMPESVARELGAPNLAGAVIGSAVTRVFLATDAFDDNGDIGPRGGCTPSTGPDVIVGDMPSIANYTAVDGIDAFSVGTTSCNIGNQNLLWVASSVNHPVIPQNMYRRRVVDGSVRFEQIGMSWMKHAFTALTQNLCCNCNGQGGGVLGIGCSDPYSATRNGTQMTNVGGLGPRFQVDPHRGAFVWPYAFRNVAHIPHNNVTRRLQVRVTDLDPALNAGAQYYVETVYVTPDDAAARNQNNNASYRTCNVTYNAGTDNASASVTGTTQREKPAIKGWKAFDPTVTETTFETPEAANSGGDTTGVGILAAKATDLGNGMWHYEYALYNQNSDRAFASFTVPKNASLDVSNMGFHDVDYHSGDGFGSAIGHIVTFDGSEWTPTEGGTTVSWALVPATPVENSNALRWATMYNFRFDTDVPPTSGNVTLGLFKQVEGLPDTVDVASVVPSEPATPCPGDTNGDNVVDLTDLATLLAHFGTASGATLADGDLDGNGTVDLADLASMLSVFGSTCP